MRISGGKYLNRKIATKAKVNKNIEYRPTSDRSRQAVFNILQNSPKVPEGVINNSIVVDICAGCGSFSFEALSRGAKRAYMIDNAKEQLELAKLNADLLGEGDNCVFIKADARGIPILGIVADIIFVDPPYECGFENNILKSIYESGIVSDKTIIILEVHKHFSLKALEQFDVIVNRDYGKTKIIFIQRKR